jgi:tRNA modification GTPase
MAGDTIFALATTPGRAAVAVLRISGPQAGAALEALSGLAPKPRRATLASLRTADGAPIDEALVLWFPGPASYTGEDCAEIQVHGGVAVVARTENALAGLGLRPAEPGEFTRRAFENGKLDLAQAEAVADLIDAQTEAQARQALGQLGGALTRRHEAWRALLIETLAFLEAAVDFPDEDVPPDVAEGARSRLMGLLAELEGALADQDRGRQVREGFKIALIGAPNAGKSTLINALAGREAAIVAETAGTTRDVVEVPMVLCGYQVLLADTAGLREAAEAVEAEGVRRAKAWAQQADLRLWMVDAAASDGLWRSGRALARPGDICVLNKSDLPRGADAAKAEAWTADNGLEVLNTALRSPDGAGPLRAALEQRVVAALSGGEFPASTRLRHQKSLKEARERIVAAMNAGEAELAAEDVRLAGRALARITGRIDAEDVLDQVFGKFCIGK